MKSLLGEDNPVRYVTRYRLRNHLVGEGGEDLNPILDEESGADYIDYTNNILQLKETNIYCLSLIAHDCCFFFVVDKKTCISYINSKIVGKAIPFISM